MFEKLKELKEKYEQLGLELAQLDIANDINKLKELSKQQSKFKIAYDLYNDYSKVKEQLESAKQLLNDEELKEVAQEEIIDLEEQSKKYEEQMALVLLPKDSKDDRNVIIEIRGAAGGDEANIFAGDLYRMYAKYAERLGWDVEVMNSEEGTSGGFTLIQFLIKGQNVYEKLKYENGSHRVQRVPVTETQGRIHTSTATVLVMPEAEDTDVEISANDVKVDVFRSGGAGGQSVNTTDSAVRLTHLPTGIVVTCQNERSQIRNKDKAMQMLKAKVYESLEHEKQTELGYERKIKIGTGDRSEKIRTYNFPQNRVTDHRLNLTIKQLDRIIEGDLNQIINNLIMEDNQQRLKEINE